MKHKQLHTSALTPEQRRRAIKTRQSRSRKNPRLQRRVAIGRGPRNELLQ